MKSSSPVPLYMIIMALVLQVPAFVRATSSRNSTILHFGNLPAPFGPSLTADRLKGFLVEVNPVNACRSTDGPPNASFFIALINWYNCSFTTKLFHVEWAAYHVAVMYDVNSQNLMNITSEADAKDRIHIPPEFITYVVSMILKELDQSGKLTSVIQVPEYFHFSWQFGSRATRSTYPYLRCIRSASSCFQMACLQVCMTMCILAPSAIAGRYFLRHFKWVKKKSHPSQDTGKEQPGTSFTSSTYQECAICLEKYLECDSLKVLSCSHAFHSKCVDLWHITQARCKTCPLCKQKVMVVTRLQAERLWKEGTRESNQILLSSKAKTNIVSCSPNCFPPNSEMSRY